ncbi:hypothetical protein B0H19DRAFT_1271496 [Mycena capillaripes]|nr:hypothetical protein B0H19DRAFT_1271496 [Mycena capillaripes]
MHSRVARSADAPTTATYIHDSPSNLKTVPTVGHPPTPEVADKFTQSRAACLGDSSEYIRVAEQLNDAPPMCPMKREVRRATRVWHSDCGDVSGRCELPPVPFQALLVDCSPEEPQNVAGAATPGIMYAHRDAPLRASLRSSAAIIVLVGTGRVTCAGLAPYLHPHALYYSLIAAPIRRPSSFLLDVAGILAVHCLASSCNARIERPADPVIRKESSIPSFVARVSRGVLLARTAIGYEPSTFPGTTG